MRQWGAVKHVTIFIVGLLLGQRSLWVTTEQIEWISHVESDRQQAWESACCASVSRPDKPGTTSEDDGEMIDRGDCRS